MCLFVHFLSNNSLSLVPQKLVVVGGTIEIARKASMFAWDGFVDCLCPFFGSGTIV